MSARSRQILALGVAVAFAGETLLGLAHQIAEQHVRCPEHGEVIHLEAGGSDSIGPHLSAADDHGRDPGRLRGTGLSGADDHDHCFALASARERLGAATAGKPVPVDPPAVAPPPEADERRLAALALYRIAPKTSPPA